MLFSLPVCVAFWRAVWAAPFEAAFGAAFADACFVAVPRWPVVRALGPLCVQRLIARAVMARLVWLRQQRVPLLPRFGHESDPEWAYAASRSCSPLCLREMDEWLLRWLFGVEVERLLRMVATPAGEVGMGLWLGALAGTSRRLAQLYGEWGRRVGAAQARALVREDLWHYLGPQARVG